MWRLKAEIAGDLKSRRSVDPEMYNAVNRAEGCK